MFVTYVVGITEQNTSVNIEIIFSLAVGLLCLQILCHVLYVYDMYVNVYYACVRIHSSIEKTKPALF